MLVIKPYNRERAVTYAQKYAFSQNPIFGNFRGIGGNCTNFVSQAIYAGSCVMNYTPTFGWYYISLDNRSPSWTGVDYFYNFIIFIIFHYPFKIRKFLFYCTAILQKLQPCFPGICHLLFSETGKICQKHEDAPLGFLSQH